MALTTFNLAINYDSLDQARIVNALKDKYTPVNGGIVPTQAQAIEYFRQDVMKALKDIVYKFEKDQAEVAALAGVSQVTSWS